MAKHINLTDEVTRISINRRLPVDTVNIVLDYTRISDGITFSGVITEFSGSGNWTTLTVPRAETPNLPGQYNVEIHDTIELHAEWDIHGSTWDAELETWDEATDGVRDEILAQDFFILTIDRTEAVYTSDTETNSGDAYTSAEETNDRGAYISSDETNTGETYTSADETNTGRAYLSTNDNADLNTNN